MEKKLSKSQKFEQRNKEVNRSKKKRILENQSTCSNSNY